MWLVFCQVDPARQAGSAKFTCIQRMPSSRNSSRQQRPPARGARAAASGHPIPNEGSHGQSSEELAPGQTTTDADPWSKYLARFRTCPNESYSAGYPTRATLKEHKHLRLFGEAAAGCQPLASQPALRRRCLCGRPLHGLGSPPARCCWPLAAPSPAGSTLPPRWPWSGSPTPDHATAVLWRLSGGLPVAGATSQHIEITFTWAWLVSVFETVAPPLFAGLPGACPAERPRRLSWFARAGA